MKPNLILRAFYQFWKALANVSLYIYFGKNIIINRERLDFEGPCILVSNHPHTLFDPLVSASKTPRYVYFLANYSLFKTPFQNWFFSTFFCIPIKRKVDNWGGDLKNEDSIDRSEVHLKNNGVLYIAVEGMSYIERRIREIKTGAARIAFGAESENDWSVGLTILPVGNNFECPTRFRKKVIVNVGEPIRVKDFRADFESNPQQAVKALSKAIGEKLSKLTIDVPNVEDDRMIRYLEEILETEELSASLHETNSAEQLFFKRKRLADFFLKLKSENGEQFKDFKKKTLTYGNQLRSWRVSDKIFKKPKAAFSEILTLVLSFPVFIWGAINNIFPYLCSKYIPPRVNNFIGYLSTGRVLAGLVFIPLFYGLQTWLIYRLSENQMLTIGYFLSLMPTGLFAWYWKEALKTLFKKKSFSKTKKVSLITVEKMKKLRKELVNAIEL